MFEQENNENSRETKLHPRQAAPVMRTTNSASISERGEVAESGLVDGIKTGLSIAGSIGSLL